VGTQLRDTAVCWDNPMIREIQSGSTHASGECPPDKIARSGDTLVIADLAWFDCIGREAEPGCKTMFDIHDEKTPLVVEAGDGKLIRGVDISVLGMCISDVRYLKIPAVLGYGAQQHGPIPPDTPLFFQITLLQILPTRKKGYSVKDAIQACKPGTRWDFVAGGCVNCPAGKHQPFAGQKGCYGCTHKQVSAEGSSDCKQGDATDDQCTGPTCVKAAPPDDDDRRLQQQWLQPT
jgi:hypothetical protein